MTLVIQRIPELPQKTVPNGTQKVVVYDPVNDTTYYINVSDLLGYSSTNTYQWNPATTYILNSVVLYQDNFWVSLQNGNMGNVPQENTWWHEVSKSQSGLTLWAAGIYSDADVYVVYDFSGTKSLLRLKDATRPFNSSNLVTELAADKWEFVGDGLHGIDSVDVTGSPNILDMKNLREKYFKGSATFAGAKTWQLNNAANLIVAHYKFEIITTVGDITTPVNFKMPKFAPWDSGTRKWTPPDLGIYLAKFTWDGAQGTLEINGAF